MDDEQDMRLEAAKNRRFAMGCAWLFVACPAVFFIVVAFFAGPLYGWIGVFLAVAATAYVVSLMRKTYNLDSIVRGPATRRTKFFGGSDDLA
ncbi:hypothetical protein EH165_14250 [Nakamurella antarctica]|uniref:Uncharacterized protein n=1 Tax=Nakamurella antarctica TaxID=1902245 RepID=A0A3G8ZPI0_9ACTN|nr:hypothetical protein [Nakamurella antarctica]AZI59129.1 hypothetical protein EH165_14250 [Nakamurella antarctica]